ncbi:MAG: hypothetical protein WKG00_36080 [Polyangiaceae bacterium]
MRKLAWLGMTTALLGCSVDDGVTAPLPDLAQRAVEVRELERLAEVPVVGMSRAAFDKLQQDEAAAIEQAELDEYAATWGRLGYFPLDADLRPAIGDSSDLAAAYYSSDDKQITVIGSVPAEILVHEHVHGLQDQHFHLDGFFHAAETSDQLLARRCVVEGDADLAAGRFALEAQGSSLQQATLDSDRLRDAETNILDSGPIPLLLAPFAIIYTRGLELAFYNLRAEAWSPVSGSAFSWTRQNEMFGALGPLDTASVLAREPVAPAAAFGLAEVPADLATDLEAIETDSLGAWLSYVLVRPQAAAMDLDPLPLAFELRGDRVLFVRELAGAKRNGHIWASTWTTQAAAAALVDGMTALHQATFDDETQPFLGTERADDGADNEPVWIEQRGTQVVIMRNIEAGLAASLAAATWGDPAPERGDSSADERSSARSPGDAGSRSAQRDRRLVRWTERLVGKGARHRLPTQLSD